MTSITEGLPRVRALTRLSVECLFGHYSYDLPMASETFDSQLAIIYGENGAGKTTLLKLLHNSVSSAHGRGHKTDILAIPFKSFSAHFSGGVVLRVSRDRAVAGTYEMEFRRRGQKAITQVFADIDGAVPSKGPFAEEQDRFLNEVKKGLELDSYFLADERILDSDLFDEEQEDVVMETWTNVEGRLVRSTGRARFRTERDRQLNLALRRAVQWVRPQALTGANTGSVNANSIYADVIKRLSMDSGFKDSLDPPVTESDIIDEIKRIAERAANQSRFGLTPRIQTRDLLDAIRQTPPERRGLIINLLQPYLDSNKARLDAMDQLYMSLKAFTEHLNSFLIDKHILFDVRRGLVVRSRQDVVISPENLSSGEKHLLMLFCNLLVSRQHPSLFLIDEPELSLNIKWQRKLVPALLSMTTGSQIQLLMATHSIELLSSYTDRVMRLPFGVD